MKQFVCFFLCINAALGALCIREKRGFSSSIEDSVTQIVFTNTKIFNSNRAQSLGTNKDAVSFFVDYDSECGDGHQFRRRAVHSTGSIQFIPASSSKASELPRRFSNKKSSNTNWHIKVEGENIALLLFDKSRRLIKLHDLIKKPAEISHEEFQIVSISQEMLDEAEEYFRSKNEDILFSLENPQIYEAEKVENGTPEYISDPLGLFNYNNYLLTDPEAGQSILMIAPGNGPYHDISISKLSRLIAAEMDAKRFAANMKQIIGEAFAIYVQIQSENRAVSVQLQSSKSSSKPKRVFQHFMSTDLPKNIGIPSKARIAVTKEERQLRLKAKINESTFSVAQLEIAGMGDGEEIFLEAKTSNRGIVMIIQDGNIQFIHGHTTLEEPFDDSIISKHTLSGGNAVVILAIPQLASFSALDLDIEFEDAVWRQLAHIRSIDSYRESLGSFMVSSLNKQFVFLTAVI